MKIERLIFKNKACGFSLVEVNLAVMLVALGLLVLFSLFPAGLNQGERAHSDTQSALFANYVMSTIRANASDATALEWKDDPGSPFLDIALRDLPLSIENTGTNPVTIPGFVLTTGNDLKYLLDITPDNSGSPFLWHVNLWVWGSKYGPTDPVVFMNRSKWFYTELFYSGMP